MPTVAPEPAAYAPAKLFDPAKLSERTLPNGVRGIVKETRGTGLVSVQVWVRAGSRFETSANSGAAHLIETLALRASKQYPRTPLTGVGGGAAEALTGLGGIVNSQTSRDATYYSTTVGAAFLPAAIRALGDAVLHPDLGDAAVEGAKADVQADIQRRNSDPIASVSDALYQTAFVNHPYRRPAIGTTDAIDALNGSSVRTYYNARYVGANISVVVIGDLQRNIAHALIAQSFNEAPTGKGSTPNIVEENAPAEYKSWRRAALVRGITLALGFRAPGIKKPEDVVAMDVLLAYWREGRQAALRKVLLGTGSEGGDAEDGDTPGSNALAIGYDVDFLTQRDPGLFIISLLLTPDKRDAALDAVMAEIAKVQKQEIEATALEHAKQELTRQYIEQDETVSGQAGALGFYDMIDSYEFGATYLDRVAKVTAADVKRIANTYLSQTAYVQATIVPAPAPRPPVRPPSDSGNTITARRETPPLKRNAVILQSNCRGGHS